MSELTSADVRIEDPDFYFEPRREIYERLHAEQPVFHYEPLDTFVLTKYHDIREAARHPEIFSSSHGLHLHQLRLTEDERAVYATLYTGEQFAYADPPRHRELRGVAARSFAPKALQYMRSHIEEQVDLLVGEIVAGKSFDFVGAIAAKLPIKVAEYFIGLPPGYDEKIRVWSDALESLKLVRGVEEISEAIRQFTEMDDFFREQFEVKRQTPGEDLISTLLDAELDGQPIDEKDLLVYCSTFLAAGSDTTRSLLAGMALALADHPDALTDLASSAESLESAVEESLRWTTPARGFLRTAVQDTQIRDVSITAGERVYLLYDAGNRDPEVFEDPWAFNVNRANSAAHLAFGLGPHLCIAAYMARLEARTLFSRIGQRFSSIERSGTAREIRQVLRNGWTEAPLTFR